ncbi:16S rRNA (guanine(966)-N(2))-methyltransferase RsmD [Helicobacter enhydrae]|uniref:16S rRNA (Guanine(966)-N(2))-methyltransferase RsmD n=1 Tax=Helicobacter enhydrae TaxID=222136 RepID=A0A1B1U533_9HELI|nr:16S rRNA (guanine(966)-N(2))-methyltransferase RsmD [Helicobacter enhydrae]ANV97812.1 16S rRNA (guanine(966)-N(2))-methyltransferase RsmD [Helicobacter enhydrae]
MIKGQKTLKILAGRFKGLCLEMLDRATTRPSKSILKESLFNVLQTDIEGAVLIEGFGGSGSIGLEAMSRGAKEAIFVEKDPDAYKVLKHNLAKLHQKDESLQMRCILGDTFEVLPTLLETLNGASVLYLDPPFAIREGMEGIYDACFKLVEAIKNPLVFLIVFEHFATQEMPQRLGRFALHKQKRFGKSALSYYVVS